MKTVELMINDWVKYPSLEGRVQSVNSGWILVNDREVSAMNVKPVPLINDILLENGFVNDYLGYWKRDGVSLVQVPSIDNHYRLTINGLGVEPKVGLDVLFVHELQHALRLAGIEWDIEL